jgi:hypothetical protein
MASLNQDVLSRVTFFVAPLPEQEAIAEALADVDALLTALDKLIAKKRAIKQAAMQQLLTGKTRLPGFTGEWKTVTVGNLAPLQRGFDLPRSQLRPGPYPVVYSNGVMSYHSQAMVKGPGVVTGRSGTEQIREMQPLAAEFLNVLSDNLKREGDLADLNTARNFEEMSSYLRRLAAAQGVLPATAKTQDDYLAWLVDRNRYLDPRGAYQTQRQVMVELQEVYISLRAEREEETTRADRELLESEWTDLERHLVAEGLRAEEIEERREQLLRRYARSLSRQQDEEAAILQLEEAVERHPLVVILGDPGSGKTTLVRFLALQAAQQILHPPRTPTPMAPPFPILLRIADYAEDDRWNDRSLTDFLPDAYARQECPNQGLGDLLHTRLAEGRCLVLLDGLDKIIDADNRRSIVQRIEDFVRRHQRGGQKGENRFVVTSRIAGYRTAPLGLDFVHFTVQEMDTEQIRGFLEKWCRAVEDANAPKSSEAERQRLANREIEGIMHAVKSTLGVRRLAANPLMLRTLALIHRTGAQLPQRRIELYKLAAETLERTWRTAQGINEAELSALLRGRELPGLLGTLAYWIHANKPSGIVTEREVEHVLGEEWARLRRLDWDPDDPDPAILGEVRKFLDAVREHTGLFVERAPRRYGFMHLTFEEYATSSLAHAGRPI